MGHMYPKEQSKRFLRRLYAVGDKGISIKEMVDILQEAKVAVSCAEGPSTEEYMQEMAVGDLVNYYYGQCVLRLDRKTKTGAIEPILETDDQTKAFDLWEDGAIWDLDDDEVVWETFFSIKWKLTKAGRKEYKDLPILDYVEH